MRTALTIAAAVVAVGLMGSSVASADVVVGEDFESGAAGWSMDGLWHVQDQPQSLSVASAINPTLVTLPDDGQLPDAASGTHAAWYGEAASGTFCTGYAGVTQSAKNGCTSSASNSGRLVSPSLASSARPAPSWCSPRGGRSRRSTPTPTT